MIGEDMSPSSNIGEIRKLLVGLSPLHHLTHSGNEIFINKLAAADFVVYQITVVISLQLYIILK